MATCIQVLVAFVRRFGRSGTCWAPLPGPSLLFSPGALKTAIARSGTGQVAQSGGVTPLARGQRPEEACRKERKENTRHHSQPRPTSQWPHGQAKWQSFCGHRSQQGALEVLEEWGSEFGACPRQEVPTSGEVTSTTPGSTTSTVNLLSPFWNWKGWHHFESWIDQFPGDPIGLHLWVGLIFH